MTNKSIVLIATLLAVLSTTSVAAAAPFFPKKYTLPDGDYSSKVVCGLDKCVVHSNNGAPFHLFRSPYSPDVSGTTDPISVARAVIGYTTVDASGGTPFYCSRNGTHPFKPEDIRYRGSATGRDVEYSRDVAIKIDVSAAVQADLDSMIALGLIPPGKLDEVKATLQAAYQSVSGTSYKAKGKFFEFSLADDVYRDLWQTEKYKECADIVRRGEAQLINAAGVLWLTVDLTQGATSTAATQVETRLKSQGINFDFRAAMSRNITESMKAHSSDLYQVLLWHLTNKETLKAMPAAATTSPR